MTDLIETTAVDITQPTPTKNMPLLWKVYDHIVAHPEEWDQSAWSIQGACGTFHCVAGHAVHMAYPDARPLWANGGSTDLVEVDGEVLEYPIVGRDILGLTRPESAQLFSGCNQLEDIHSLILKWDHEESEAWLAKHP